MASQLTFSSLKRNDLQHGGTLNQGKRKLRRPFDRKKPVHLVMRSSKAKGKWALTFGTHVSKIEKIVTKTAAASHVQIFQYANAGNHLHILVKAPSKSEFQRFLRIISGLIPRLVTGACKGNPTGKFWDCLAYTRVVTWGREFVKVRKYVLQNALEGMGILFHRPSKIHVGKSSHVAPLTASKKSPRKSPD